MTTQTPQKALDKINECKRTKSKGLNLSHCELTFIPKEIVELTWLKELLLSYNKISKIEHFYTLIKLTTLDLRSNQISKIEGIGTLSKLTSLSLSGNQISKIEGINTLTNLISLSLPFNQISKIEGVEDLTNLRTLWLDSNQITKIEGIGNLTNLTQLYLSNNQIAKIEGIENLTNLSWFDLSSNQIAKIEGVENLMNLTRLDLDSNQITDLSPLLSYIKKGLSVDCKEDNVMIIQGISVKNNSLQIPDIETVQRGNEAILAYFEEKEAREAAEKKTLKINTRDKNEPLPPSVKMVLLGNSNVGKTNLSRYLREEKFETKDRDSTHGILVEQWLPNDENLLVNIWDFGGQEYYHDTYRLFLTNKIVFVLVWDKLTNENTEKITKVKDKNGEEKYENVQHFEFQYWLDIIAHYSPEAPIFLVQNKIDEIGNERERIETHFFQNYKILEDHAISLMRGSQKENVKAHRQLDNFIAELKSELALHTYTTDFQYRLKIRDWLFDLQEEETKNDNPFLPFKKELHITKTAFENVIKSVEKDISQTILNDILDWLNTRGNVVYFKDNATLNNMVFLQPKKVSKIIYDVLTENILKKGGEFTTQDIDSQEIDNESIKNIMLQMNIIFEVKNKTGHYIAPQYLPTHHALQDLYAIAESNLNSHSYFVKMPLFYYRRAMQQLILFYGNNQNDDCKSYFWKHGVLIQKNDVRLLIKGLYPSEGEREGIISVSTDKGIGFFDLQKEVFGKIIGFISGEQSVYTVTRMKMERFGSVNRTIIKEKITNEDGTERVIYDSETLTSHFIPKVDFLGKEKNKLWLNRLEVSTDGTFFCPYTRLLEQAEQGNLKIDGFHKNDKNISKSLNINNFQIMMDKEVERPLRVFVSYSHDDLALQKELNKHLMPLVRSERIEVWKDNMIPAGDNWDETILTNLRQADVVILLLSANFVSSNYIWNIELKEAWKLRQEGKLVIPIYGKEFYYHDLQFKTLDNKKVNLGDFQFIPKNEEKDDRVEAIESWANQNKALATVSRIVSQKINDYKAK